MSQALRHLMRMAADAAVWSEDMLNRWLAGAPIVVPGTPMDELPYAPMTEPRTRALVIAFLRTLGPPSGR